jgi:hypothetical protein
MAILDNSPRNQPIQHTEINGKGVRLSVLSGRRVAVGPGINQSLAFRILLSERLPTGIPFHSPGLKKGIQPCHAKEPNEINFPNGTVPGLATCPVKDTVRLDTIPLIQTQKEKGNLTDSKNTLPINENKPPCPSRTAGSGTHPASLAVLDSAGHP